ncbi:unnamed protein product, partial [Prorocentrum cordatum]
EESDEIIEVDAWAPDMTVPADDNYGDYTRWGVQVMKDTNDKLWRLKFRSRRTEGYDTIAYMEVSDKSWTDSIMAKCDAGCKATMSRLVMTWLFYFVLKNQTADKQK